MVYIYVLELKSYKYYIGKTTNPYFRLKEHFNANGSSWTKKYVPFKVLELIEGDDEDEDKYTIKYMKKYGIDNVRGGSFCRLELSYSDRTTLDKMIVSQEDKCFKCNKKGHFAIECKSIICNRCNRVGHTLDNCYAKTNVKGEELSEDEYYICNTCEKEFETEKEAITHDKYCNKKKKCFRCNRFGHNSNECYARTMIY